MVITTMSAAEVARERVTAGAIVPRWRDITLARRMLTQSVSAMLSRIRWTRSVWYTLAGAVLSIGAPTGLLVLREVYAPRPVTAELMSDRLTYLYVLLASALVLAFVGFLLGRQADRLASLSQTDALTGLPNRRALNEHIREELRRAARYRTPVSLLLIDVDGLKQVNDAHGHAAGDRVIRTIARAITHTLRESDFGARWGGDEFGIVAPNTTSAAARASAERLVNRVRSVRDGHGFLSTVSVGIATFDPNRSDHADVESLVGAADRALYQAKADGRNRVEAA
jgi:diguanylate cyclase (GGDEF)-like protein